MADALVWGVIVVMAGIMACLGTGIVVLGWHGEGRLYRAVMSVWVVLTFAGVLLLLVMASG